MTYASFTGEEWRRGPAQTDFRAPDKVSRTWIATNGQRTRRAAYTQDPREINSGFGFTAGQTAGTLLDGALEPVHDYYSTRTATGERVNKPVPEWIDDWARLIYEFDHLSMTNYLTEQAGLPIGAVDAIGTLENLTSRGLLSFIHSFMSRSVISAGATYWEIVGGTAQLPYALLSELQDEIRMNRRMIRMEYWDPGRDCSACTHVSRNGPKVWVETTSEQGGDDAESGTPNPRTETFTADVALVTIPFSALRHVAVEPLMSYPKRRAIIELHYDSATKVLLEFSKRYALGEAAVFLPSQLTELHPDITTPEGPVHFAGEHTSLKHSWIEGSLESAVRTALDIN